MQIYLDDTQNTITMVQSVASASTMISSVAKEAKDYVISKFPKNFFKHVFVDTSQAITQTNYNRKYSQTANKIRYPSLAVTPVMSLDDPIGGMEKGMHLSSPNLYLRRDLSRIQTKLLVDPDKQFSIYYSADYITTNFDFKITTNTYISNVNIAHYLKSRFQPAFFQFVNNRYIQTEIPKTFIHVIANIFGYDLNDNDDMDKLRLYMIGAGKSNDTIQKKLNPGTGKQCFFLDMNENLLTLFTDLDCPPSIVRDGQTEGEYTISFRVQVSCYIPNAFILNIDKNRLQQLDSGVIEELDSSRAVDQLEEGITSEPVVSSRILTKEDTIYFYDRNGNEQIGHLVYHETFTHDMNSELEQIYILHDYNAKNKSEFTQILDYAIANNFDLTSLLKIKVFTNDGELSESDCLINYEELKITMLNEKYAQSDIVVALYVSRLAYEFLKKKIESDDFYTDDILTTVYAKTTEQDEITGEAIEKPIRLVVHSLKTADTFDGNTSPLRINTAYGIGYIGLLDDSTENLYKICVGYDDKKNPIIKTLEIKEA